MKKAFQAGEQAAAGIITIVLFSVFQYLKFLKDGEWGSCQSLAYCILALVMMLALVLGAASGRQEMRKPAKPADLLLVAMLLLGLGSFLYQLFTGRPDIERELLFLAVPLSYYVYSCGNATNASSLDLFLGAGTVIYLVLYLDFFFGEDLGLTPPGTALAEEWFSWLLLSAAAGMLLYCNAKGRRLHFAMGLCFSLASFGLILLYQDATLIYLTGLALLLLPVAHRPDKEFLRRHLQLLFIWIALLSNVRIPMELAGIEVNAQLYGVGCSAFLEVAAVTVGILVLLAWDNMPEEAGEQVRWLEKAKKLQLLALYAYIAFLLLLLTGPVDGWSAKEDVWVDPASLSREWAECRSRTPNLFQTVYGDWGTAGVVFLGLLFLSLFYQTAGRYREDRKGGAGRRQDAMLIPLGMLFAVQCFFWKVDAGTLPVYVWAAGSILQEKKETALRDGGAPVPWERKKSALWERQETDLQGGKETAPQERQEAAPQERKELVPQERQETAPQERQEAAPQDGKEPAPQERQGPVPQDKEDIILRRAAVRKTSVSKEHTPATEEIGT